MTIEPDPDALQAMNAHYNRIVDRWHAGELRDVGSYALRWTEQAWRIAVCIHAGKWGKDAALRTLAIDTAQAAITLADWFAGQQLNILAAGREARQRKQFEEALALLAETPKGITTRDVHRARITPTAEDAHRLLADMEARGILAGQDIATGGRPSRIYSRKAHVAL